MKNLIGLSWPSIYDHDEFYKDHSDTYSGLADARGVWEDAKRFFTKEKSE